MPSQRAKTINTFIKILIIFFCLQEIIQNFIPVFRYVDELMAISFFLIFFIQISQKDFFSYIQNNTLVIALFTVLFLFTGIASTLLNDVQPISNVCMDMIVWVKFIFIIASGFLLYENVPYRLKYVDLIPVLDIVTLGLVVLFIADLIFGISNGEMRFGLRAIKLLYGSYTTCAAAMCFMAAIYMRMYEFLKEKILLRLIPLWIIMIATLRFKAICAVFLMLFVYIFICRRRRMIGPFLWGTMGAGFFLICLRSIFFYFVMMKNESARAALLRTSIKIARDYFPLGTGFATFGSAFSVEPYSKIYDIYHINNVWGMSRAYNAFISDSFWPYLLGETGVLGMILFVVILAAIFSRVSKLRKINAYTYASAMVCFVYLLISSSGESAFANAFAVYFGLWIGMLLSEEVGSSE